MDVWVAGGDGSVMANWFSMTTKVETRPWLWGLPSESISSWRGLSECFLDKFTTLGREHENPKEFVALSAFISRAQEVEAEVLGALGPSLQLRRKFSLLVRNKCNSENPITLNYL
jgi:hypothetical protein